MAKVYPRVPSPDLPHTLDDLARTDRLGLREL